MDHDTQALPLLRDFREQFYASALGHRKDSLFELLEAVLCASGPESLVRLSLAPPFQRCWSSTCDALSDGSLDATRLRRLFVHSLPTLAADSRDLWVIDGTTWPRPSAATSPERTYCHRVATGIPQDGVVPGWEYQWLVGVPEEQGSWVLPLDVRRRRPDSASPTALALEQVHAAIAARSSGGSANGAGRVAPRPLVVPGGGYDPAQLASSEETKQADFLVRLARNRGVLPSTRPALRSSGRSSQARQSFPSGRSGYPRGAGSAGDHGRTRVRTDRGCGLDRPAHPAGSGCALHRHTGSG